MKAVGIRDLKNHLSEYIRLVRSGEDVLVTDWGEVVAELRPPGQSPLVSQYPILSDLVRQAKVRLGAPNDPALYVPPKKLLDHQVPACRYSGTNLGMTNIDSQQQLICVRRRKDHKDRYVMLNRREKRSSAENPPIMQKSVLSARA